MLKKTPFKYEPWLYYFIFTRLVISFPPSNTQNRNTEVPNLEAQDAGPHSFIPFSDMLSVCFRSSEGVLRVGEAECSHLLLPQPSQNPQNVSRASPPKPVEIHYAQNFATYFVALFILHYSQILLSIPVLYSCSLPQREVKGSLQ